MDDGRSHFQERNVNNFNDPMPSQPTEIPSNQNQQSTKSVNTRSDGHHYKEGNASFMSSFSRMDNDRRREFQPFQDRRRMDKSVNEVRPGDQLPRGVANAPNRRFDTPPPPMMPNVGHRGMGMESMGVSPEMMMGPGMGMDMGGPEMMMGPGYMEEQMYFEESPMMGGGMMMEEDYFNNDMMYPEF